MPKTKNVDLSPAGLEPATLALLIDISTMLYSDAYSKDQLSYGDYELVILPVCEAYEVKTAYTGY